MNRFTFLIDIAGRVSLGAEGNPRVTAAAVVISTASIDRVRNQLPKPLPKWKGCTAQDARSVVNLLLQEAIAIGVFSINRDTVAWRQFWEDAKPLQNAIVAQDNSPAGFVKPANVMVFQMIGGAAAVGGGHALRVSSKTRIQDHRGLDLIERNIICDSEINGAENLAVFAHLWERQDGWQPRLESAGIRMTTAQVRVTTEEDEPLLLLADYAAGLAHTTLLPEPGRLPLPLSLVEATDLLNEIDDAGKLAVHSGNFDLKYRDIFGDAMSAIESEKS